MIPEWMISFDPSSMTAEQAARYEVSETGDFGVDSGRKRFRVMCRECGMVLHGNTTGPEHYIEQHDKEKHGA